MQPSFVLSKVAVVWSWKLHKITLCFLTVVLRCDVQGMPSGDSPCVAVAQSITSKTSESPPSYAAVSVNYEPSENTVSVLYTPPCLTSTDDSPSVPETAASRPSVMTGSYEAVLMSEPDLSKVPERSALKGGKTRQLQEKRRGKENRQEVTSLPLSPKTAETPPHPHPAAVQFNSTGHLRVRPKVPPKPRIGPWVQHFHLATLVWFLKIVASYPICEDFAAFEW